MQGQPRAGVGTRRSCAMMVMPAALPASCGRKELPALGGPRVSLGMPACHNSAVQPKRGVGQGENSPGLVVVDDVHWVHNLQGSPSTHPALSGLRTGLKAPRISLSAAPLPSTSRKMSVWVQW